MQKSTLFLLVMALASAGISAGLWFELRDERALNAELTERLAAAQPAPVVAPTPVEQPPSPEAATVTTKTESVQTAAATPAATSAAETGGSQVKTTQTRAEDWQARQRRLMNDPRYREAWREQQRLQMAQRRDNYIQLLGFTPEQADAAIELSLDRQMTMYDRSQFSGSMEDAERWQERQKAEEQAYQAKLRDALGAEKAAQLQTYMESRQSRMQVDRFRSQLTGADALRDDQVEPLISALHAEQSQMQKDLQEWRDSQSTNGNSEAAQRQFFERQAEALKAAHKRMHSSASGILSSSQLERFDAMLRRELERHEAQLRMQRIQSKLEPREDANGSSN